MSNKPSHFASLLWVKIKLNLKAESDRLKLGYLWWLLEPLLHACAFYFIFVYFLNLRTENFLAYLISGLIPFTWFSRSVSNSMASLKGAKGLLTNFKIHPMFFPLVHLGQDAVKQGVTFAFLLVFLVVYGIEPNILWLSLPLVMVLQAFFVTGVACFTASILPLLEDLKFLVTTVLMIAMFASGVFYNPIEVLPASLKPWFYMNPTASLLQIYRDILLFETIPSVYHISIVLLWSLLFMLVALVSMRLLRDHYAKLVLQ
jgi:lipopolysaccharide transport system permease protein